MPEAHVALREIVIDSTADCIAAFHSEVVAADTKMEK